MKGKFITFEGIDGSGKSTQASLFHSKLLSFGIPCILLREPGGTKIGEDIRSILLDNKNDDMSPLTELFLYLAARSQITYSQIFPALDKGTTVIMDRFIDSTTAYQGYARGLGIETTSKLNMIATSGLIPDITFLVDCDPHTAFSRLGKSLDRLESEGINFLNKVREGFLKISTDEKHRVFVVDGSQCIEIIENILFNEIKKRGFFDSL
jgi:dTMP kinase